MARTNTVRKQVRGFAIVWTLVTILMGACTAAVFLAASGLLNASTSANPGRSNVALPVATNPGAARAVIVPTNTPFPTRQPTAVPPTADPEVAAAEAATAAPQPTRLPVDVDEFEVGIQVQVSFDLMDAWMDVASNQLG